MQGSPGTTSETEAVGSAARHRPRGVKEMLRLAPRSSRDSNRGFSPTAITASPRATCPTGSGATSRRRRRRRLDATKPSTHAEVAHLHRLLVRAHARQPGCRRGRSAAPRARGGAQGRAAEHPRPRQPLPPEERPAPDRARQDRFHGGGRAGAARPARSAQHAANTQRRRDLIRLRGFRNLLVGGIVVFSLIAVGLGLIGGLAPTTMPLCSPPRRTASRRSVPRAERPVGKADPTTSLDPAVEATVTRGDVWVVELLGLLGRTPWSARPRCASSGAPPRPTESMSPSRSSSSRRAR